MPATSNANRSYAAAHFALELDKKDNVGLFRSVEGGGVRADVMTFQNGVNYDRIRQLGRPKYEDIKVQVGMAMSKPFYLWIENFFAGVPDRRNGAIVAADFYYTERARREFTEAMIKELTFPKLDATDKNPVYMSVAIAVEDIQFLKGNGNTLAAPGGGWANQKLWSACNFILAVDGFPSAKRCTKIDSFTVKQTIIEHAMGGHRGTIKTPSAIDFPNISFYLPEADAGDFMAAANLRISKGNDGGNVPSRFSGSLQTFDHSNRTLATLTFSDCDIVSVTPDKSDSTSEEIKMVKVEIYTQKMKFEYNAV